MNPSKLHGMFLFCLALLCQLNGLLQSSSLAAEPQWIWSSADANQTAPPVTCFFSKSFKVEEPESGQVEITCDNRYVLRLNGRLVGASNNWQQMDRYDVSSLLVKGENHIDIRCVNDGDAAGLAVRVTIKSKGQNAQAYSTNKSWITRMNVGKSWNPAALADIKPAETFVLGELGKTAPWGTKFKMGPVIKRDKPADDLSQPFELLDGDRVVFLGNTFIERAQSYGYLELALTSYWPDRNITFRNLGWSGDTVTGIARARFGTVADGFRHLTEHVYALKPTVIFVAYGANESFAGEAGLDKFRTDLTNLLGSLEATGARIVLLSPLRHENLGAPLPDPTKQNRNIRLYQHSMQELATAHGIRYADLDQALYGDSHLESSTPVRKPPLTDNGIHLTDAGYQKAAQSLLAALGLPEPCPDLTKMENLRQKILKKNELYFHRWRPQNETYLYLFRKHEQGNNAKEIPEFDPLIEEMEAEIAALRNSFSTSNK